MNKGRADAVLHAFDFEKVQRAMRAVGWKYCDSDETPSVARLRKMARSLTDYLEENRCEEVSSGGFTARLVSAELSGAKVIELQFILAHMDEEMVGY